MKNETKLGLVFISILLTIFVGLLMKRLARPGIAVIANARQPANAANDAGPAKLTRQAPPTLVTPKGQSGKPPESVAAETSSNRTEKPSQTAKPSRPVAQNPPASSPTASASDPAPSLIATPMPVAEVGDRYAKAARDPFDSAASNPSNSNSPQPYRSGYADTNENRSDSHPSREKTDTRSAGGPRNGEPTVSESRRSEPRPQADRYSSTPRQADLYPIPASEPPVTQRYPTPNVTVASTGAIAPAAAGIQRDGDKYSVQPNDSFWTISEKAYGTGAFFKALYEHNRKLHPEVDEMKVGQLLSVPDESVLRHSYPDLCPAPRKQVAGVQQRLASASGRMLGSGRVYTVEDGDTLFEIARHELGKTSPWAEIYDLNREVMGNDFDYLRPGTELILPDEKSKGENMTRQPTSVYPR